MKKCPFCAEEIQDAAVKCRWCGEFLSESHSVQTADAVPSVSDQAVETIEPVPQSADGSHNGCEVKRTSEIKRGRFDSLWLIIWALILSVLIWGGVYMCAQGGSSGDSSYYSSKAEQTKRANDKAKRTTEYLKEMIRQGGR